MTGEYKNMRRVILCFGGNLGNAVLVPVCEKCGRFVKMDEIYYANEAGNLHGGNQDESLALCSRCGRTTVPFEGWFSDKELAE